MIYDTKLLKTPLSASLLYILQAKNGKLGLPEVLELELNKQFLKYAKESITKVIEGYNNLGILMGSCDDYRIPNDDTIRNKVNERLNRLEQLILRIPFSFNNARNALSRINSEIPPNGPKDQQFKDSVIWENILEASAEYDVHFITKDKGFYEDRCPEKGLAASLKTEINSKSISIYYELQAFLNKMAKAIPKIDKARLAQILYKVHESGFKEYCREKNFEIINMRKYDINTYLTGNPEIAISYSLIIDIKRKDDETLEWAEAEAHIKGEFEIDLNNIDLDKLNIPLTWIKIYDHEGNELPGGLIVAYGMFSANFGGRRSISHRIRVENPYE